MVKIMKFGATRFSSPWRVRGFENPGTVHECAPEEDNDPNHQCDIVAYAKWTKKDHCVRFVILSSMYNCLISAFEEYKTARKCEMPWNTSLVKPLLRDCALCLLSLTLMRCAQIRIWCSILDRCHPWFANSKQLETTWVWTASPSWHPFSSWHLEANETEHDT